MHIDIQTAAIFSITVHLILFIILLVYARVAKQYDGVFHWALWNLLFSCGMAVWLSRVTGPLWFSVIFGNSLMIFAACFAYRGSARFVGRRSNSPWIFALPAATLLLYIYFTLYADSVVMRRAILSLMGSAIFLATAYVILRAPSPPYAAAYRFTGGVFALYGIALLFRALLVTVVSPQPSALVPSFEQALFFLISPLFSLLITVGFGLMITQRLFAELQQAGTALEQEHGRTKIMLENLANGVVACDAQGRFTLFNEVARNFYEWTAANASIDQVSEAHPIYQADGRTPLNPDERPLYRALSGEQVRGRECVLLSKQGEARHFLVNASPLMNASGDRLGAVAIFADITERKLAEAAQARLLAELQQALTEIKTLRGLLPICAHCKSIRDDSGFWQGVEEYLQQRTEAEFSHGICPECFEKHFGEFVRSRKR